MGWEGLIPSLTSTSFPTAPTPAPGAVLAPPLLCARPPPRRSPLGAGAGGGAGAVPPVVAGRGCRGAVKQAARAHRGWEGGRARGAWLRRGVRAGGRREWGALGWREGRGQECCTAAGGDAVAAAVTLVWGSGVECVCLFCSLEPIRRGFPGAHRAHCPLCCSTHSTEKEGQQQQWGTAAHRGV